MAPESSAGVLEATGARQRYWIGSRPLPGGGTRELFVHDEASARAALSALRRDPGLIHTITADEYVDLQASGALLDAK